MKKLLLLSTLAMSSLCTHVYAGIMTTFTDRTSWEAAVGAGNFNTEVFDTTDPNPFNSADPTIQLPLGETDVGLFNIRYTTIEGVDETNNQIVDADGSSAFGGLRDGDYLQLEHDRTAPDRTLTLQFWFDSPINAFGANFMLMSSTANVGLSLDGGTADIYTGLGSSPNGFLGFILDNPVSVINFFASSAESDTFYMDNVSLGNVAPVPVPAAVWLMGSALLGLVGFNKKKQTV